MNFLFVCFGFGGDGCMNCSAIKDISFLYTFIALQC